MYTKGRPYTLMSSISTHILRQKHWTCPIFPSLISLAFLSCYQILIFIILLDINLTSPCPPCFDTLLHTWSKYLLILSPSSPPISSCFVDVVSSFTNSPSLHFYFIHLFTSSSFSYFLAPIHMDQHNIRHHLKMIKNQWSSKFIDHHLCGIMWNEVPESNHHIRGNFFLQGEHCMLLCVISLILLPCSPNVS